VAITAAKYLRPMPGRSSSTFLLNASAHSSLDIATSGAGDVAGFVFRAIVPWSRALGQKTIVTFAATQPVNVKRTMPMTTPRAMLLRLIDRHACA